ncbi:hypothetical protein QE436_001116 [Pantoea anthophila]|nr:hypothetical protein [Pantoea anthophila]
MDICKGITRFSHGYEYGKDTEIFIKEKNIHTANGSAPDTFNTD